MSVGKIDHTRVAGGIDVSAVNATIHSIVRDIDAQLENATNNGKESITVTLPESFHVGKVTKAQAQAVIFTELITLYKSQRGFSDVTISLKRNTFNIGWSYGIPKDDYEMRMALISQHLVADEKKKVSKTS